jgi:hypothetical protein
MFGLVSPQNNYISDQQIDDDATDGSDWEKPQSEPCCNDAS